MIWIGICDENVNRKSFNLPRKGCLISKSSGVFFPTPLYLPLLLFFIDLSIFCLSDQIQDIRYYLCEKAIKFIVFAQLV